MKRPASARAGFTLAEVMVTLMIVAIGLVLVLEGLQRSKISAAQTHNRKVARQLAQLTVGQLEAGLFWEELDGASKDEVLTGTYAEDGYEDFHYEMVLGQEEFRDESTSYRDQGYHDSWEYERQREERLNSDKDDEEADEADEPFQKVRIRVSYPNFGEQASSFVLERWIPWDLVYGSEDDEDAKSSDAASSGGGGP